MRRNTSFLGVLLFVSLLTSKSHENRVEAVPTGRELKSKIGGNKGLLFVMLYDSQCSHCLEFVPRYEEKAEALHALHNKVKFVRIDLHDKPHLIEEYMTEGLASFPSIVLYHGPILSELHAVEMDLSKSLQWMENNVLTKEHLKAVYKTYLLDDNKEPLKTKTASKEEEDSLKRVKGISMSEKPQNIVDPVNLGQVKMLHHELAAHAVA